MSHPMEDIVAERRAARDTELRRYEKLGIKKVYGYNMLAPDLWGCLRCSAVYFEERAAIWCCDD